MALLITVIWQIGHPWPRLQNDRAQFGVPNVTARDPDHLRGRPVATDQLHEVVVLRDDDRCTSSARRGKDHGVVRGEELNVLDVLRIDSVGVHQPPGERGGNCASTHTTGSTR
jgi:hypothetical protein